MFKQFWIAVSIGVLVLNNNMHKMHLKHFFISLEVPNMFKRDVLSYLVQETFSQDILRTLQT
jgi:hypothetical protein